MGKCYAFIKKSIIGEIKKPFFENFRFIQYNLSYNILEKSPTNILKWNIEMNVKYFPIKYFVQKWYFKSQHLPKTPKYLYHKNRIISIDFTLKSTGGPKSEDRPRSLEKDILTVIYLFSSWK